MGRKNFIKQVLNKVAVKTVSVSLLVSVFMPISMVTAQGNIYQPDDVVTTVADIFEPISVTGFNKDVIAEKITVFGASVGEHMDNNKNVFYTDKVLNLWPALQSGFPSERVITSEATKGMSFQIAAYDKSNALLFTSSSSTGTLTFSKSASYGRLFLLATSTDGDTYMDITVKFTDGSSTIYNNVKIQDWYNGDNYAIRTIGSFSVLDKNTNNWKESGEPVDAYGNKGNPRLYETILSLKGADQNKAISSLYFNSNFSSSDTRKAAIFAVTGGGPGQETIPDVPQLTSVTNITQESATLNWNTVSNATEYYVDVATSQSFSGSSIVGSYNNTKAVGSSLDLTGLKAETTYYYRVRAKNSIGTSQNSVVGMFKTLAYELTITKHPDSITVEENNINATLSVEAETNSKKPITYTWYLCSDTLGNNVIQKDTSGEQYSVPTDLMQGEYYVYCEIGNQEVKTVRSKIATITVKVIYNLDLSWGEMKFEFDPNKGWDPKTHTCTTIDSYGWNAESMDGKNNKIGISNHSSRVLDLSIKFLAKDGVFNKIFDAETSAQGRFYKTNNEALKASKLLDNLSTNLSFGTGLVEEKVGTDRGTNTQGIAKIETYFAFSGIPDYKIDLNNQGNLREYQAVGSIQIKIKTDNK